MANNNNKSSTRKRIHNSIVPIAMALDEKARSGELDDKLLARIADLANIKGYDTKKEVWEEGQTSARIDYVGRKPIESLEAAIAHFKVDTERWEPYKQRANSWTTTIKNDKNEAEQVVNYAFEAHFRLKDQHFLLAEETRKAMRHMLRKYRAPKVQRLNIQPSRTLASFNIVDAHLDKLAMLLTSREQSTLEGNIQLYLNCFQELLNYALRYKPEIGVILVGNDLFNTNDFGDKTKNGTPQDLVCHPMLSYPAIKKAIITSIDMLRQFIPKVVVMVVKGNHDDHKIFYLGESLADRYHDCPEVEVVDGHHQRKYLEYGATLLAYAHGDKERQGLTPKSDLIQNMMEEMPEAYARTKFHEMRLGDLHQEIEKQYSKLGNHIQPELVKGQPKYRRETEFVRSRDYKGGRVRYMRAISPACTWTHDNAYISIPKGCELEIFDYEKGLTTIHQLQF